MEFPRRIALAEVKELMQRGLPLVFIDARQESDWKNSDLKLPDAVRVPPDDMEAHLHEVPRDGATTVVYCACPNERSSAKVGKKLIDHGMQRVFCLSGGYSRWLESDAPMQRKDEKRRAVRVQTQPNLVSDTDVVEEAAGGKGPAGEPRKGRD